MKTNYLNQAHTEQIHILHTPRHVMGKSNVTSKRLDKGGVNVSTRPHFLRTPFHSERRLKQLG